MILLLGIIFLLLWIFVFSKGGGGGTPTNTPTQTATTTTPTQTVSPPPLAACTRDQVTATLGDPEGAAGSTTVPVVIGNTSAERVLHGGLRIRRLHLAGRRHRPVRHPPTTRRPSPQQIVVGPGNEAAQFTMTITDAANECDAPVSTLGFRVTLPGMTDTIDIDNTDYMACGDESTSLLKVGPVGPGGSG